MPLRPVPALHLNVGGREEQQVTLNMRVVAFVCVRGKTLLDVENVLFFTLCFNIWQQ